MSEIELNKIFAAILIAGITFMLSGFVADLLIHEKKLKEPAVPIAGVEREDGEKKEEKEELPEPVLGLIASADTSTGEKLSRQCAACHSFEKGGPNKIGPNLWDVVNTLKGAKEGFSYSSALMEKGGKWTYANLNKFLWRPDWYIDGTKMNYIGIKKPEKRAAMIAWLRTLADNPAPLPTEEEIAAEKAELAPPPEKSEEESSEKTPGENEKQQQPSSTGTKETGASETEG